MKAKGVAMKAPKPPQKPPTQKASTEDTKAKSIDKSNPWGIVDNNQYYIDLGGVSNFLQHRKALMEQRSIP